MMRRINWFVLMVMVGLTMVPALARAAGPGAREGSRGPESMGEMMRGMQMGASGEMLGRERPLISLALRHRQELGLSPEQVKILQGLAERFRKDAEARLSQIEMAEGELAALLKGESVDLSGGETKVRSIEALRADLRIARIRTIEEGRASLAPEQRKKLEQLIAGSAPQRSSERARGMEEMERFMSSERMPQAMASMMEMARRMGDGDVMLGMVRMMEMMGSMGGMMGGPGGMMGGPGHDMPREPK
ncbi:MAG: Spy/CpxP family protein refolding chaperone [Candidatus Rokuibacteriota bacterium]